MGHIPIIPHFPPCFFPDSAPARPRSASRSWPGRTRGCRRRWSCSRRSCRCWGPSSPTSGSCPSTSTGSWASTWTASRPSTTPWRPACELVFKGCAHTHCDPERQWVCHTRCDATMGVCAPMVCAVCPLRHKWVCHTLRRRQMGVPSYPFCSARAGTCTPLRWTLKKKNMRKSGICVKTMWPPRLWERNFGVWVCGKRGRVQKRI